MNKILKIEKFFQDMKDEQHIMHKELLEAISDMHIYNDNIIREQWKIFEILQKKNDNIIREQWKLFNKLEESCHLDIELLKKIDFLRYIFTQNMMDPKILFKEYFPIEYAQKIHSLFPIHEVNNTTLCRVGKIGDGGYVMAGNFPKKGIAYSIGISTDISWDKAMLELGLSDIYMYDHTIDGLPEDNDGYHWEKKGIIGTYDASSQELITLDMMIKQNNHCKESEMILKIDVEGAEWEVFANIEMDLLGKFSQIVVEFHDVCNIDNLPLKIKALTNINKTHVPVHVHGNNWKDYICCRDFCLPDALEVSYVNKNIYDVTPKSKFFPTAIDQPNNNRYNDLILGKW